MYSDTNSIGIYAFIANSDQSALNDPLHIANMPACAVVHRALMFWDSCLAPQRSNQPSTFTSQSTTAKTRLVRRASAGPHALPPKSPGESLKSATGPLLL